MPTGLECSVVSAQENSAKLTNQRVIAGTSIAAQRYSHSTAGQGWMCTVCYCYSGSWNVQKNIVLGVDGWDRVRWSDAYYVCM